jgi:4-aminobutyrate aminotransferase
VVHKQIDLGIHLQQNCMTSKPMLELLPKVGKYLPPKMSKDYQVFFSNSGAECVENAVKLARQVTKRPNTIVFRGGFHGRTIGAGSLTTAKWYYRANNAPLPSGVHVVDYPYCYQCDIACKTDGKYSRNNCCQVTQTQLKHLLKQETSGDEIGAILIEPILGEGGYVVPPVGFFKQIREFADSIGALVIFDEVQSGFGRTGTMFACTHSEINIEPDIIACAKGLANGFPLSAIITRSEIFAKAKPGSVGGTYSGNPVACASASKVFDIFEKENILDNVNARGKQLREGLEKLKSKGFPIGDVRGLGLMSAVEFSNSVPVGTAGNMVKACENEGLLVVTAGIYETLRFIPPLNITQQEMQLGLEKLEKAMQKVFKK